MKHSRADDMARVYLITAALFFWAGIQTLQAQTFTDISAGLTGEYLGTVTWGDYDNDGDLDLLQTGYNGAGGDTELYRNDGGGIFTEVAFAVTDLYYSSAAWGDYDADGDLDLAINGFTGSAYYSGIWENDGAGSFTEAVALTGMQEGSIDWGDYDGDGDLDLLQTGYRGAYDVELYRNDGNNTFTEVFVGLAAVRYSDTDWSDYDKDGDLDLILTGYNGSVGITQLYRNNGDDTFSAMSDSFTDMYRGAVAWGDFNGDGKPDLALGGYDGKYDLQVYVNDGDGTFTLVANLTGGDYASLAWGDVDNDGDLDLAFSGYNTAYRSVIYSNNGDSTFTNISAGLTGLRFSSTALGDYDEDGDLDLLQSGYTGSTYITRIYQNGSTTANLVPNAPSGLSVTASNDTTVTLSWSAGSDTESSTDLLTYNVYVGTATGDDNIRPAEADIGTGYRRIATMGSLGNTTSYTITRLSPDSTYYWSVQAIDAGLKGSPFATESSFQTVEAITLSDLSASLDSLVQGAGAWGDYDGDGDLDLAYSGHNANGKSSRIYRNDGSGTFTDISAGLTGVNRSAMAWGDYDADGDLDLFLGGENSSSTGVAAIYRNDGSGTFTDISAGIEGVYDASAAWGDFDNDGDLDLHLSGIGSTSGRFSRIYRNDGSGSFIDNTAGLVAVSAGDSDWGDYDGDGYLDLLLTGSTASGDTTLVYRNDGSGTLNVVTTVLTGLRDSDGSWGDYDADGDLDILIAGSDGTNSHAIVYRNDGSNTFTDISAGLTGISDGAVAWNDFDSDGDLDILISGMGSAGRTTSVYRNTGNDTFNELTAGLPGYNQSEAAWGDYDGDGDLDLFLAGYDGSVRSAKIYANGSTRSNTTPSVPTNLQATSTDSSVTLSWSAPTDSETASAGLTYKVYLGTSSSNDDVMPGQSNLSDGFNRLADFGTVNGTSLTLNGLNAGTTYYWSVQAVDAGFSASDFATEQTVQTAVNMTYSTISASINGVRYGDTAWGDYDNDGDLDFAITGQTSGGIGYAEVYRNDGAGTFTPIGALTEVYNASVSWGDYNGDGYLDLHLTGYTGSSYVSSIYRNDGATSADTFTDISAGLSVIDWGESSWGDYDNDGDLDLFQSGRNLSQLYRNDGSDQFTQVSTGITAVHYSANAWGDYDNDGDLDLLITGYTTSGTYVTLVYRNDGSGTFTDISAGLTGLRFGSADWGDYDSDGDLDILVSGEGSGTSDFKALVYRNDGSDTFTDIAAGLVGVTYSSADWGDYDNDGDLDILINGYDGTSSTGSTYITRIYNNSGNDSFSLQNSSETDLSQGYYGSVMWGDYDNDGDLDIIQSGFNSTYYSEIYNSNLSTANTVPSAPSGLAATANNDTTITLSWSAPTDTETASAALSYNIYLGTASQTDDVVPAEADITSGSRRYPELGLIQSNQVKITGLDAAGTYYWSVQAVDGALAGGAFATEESFSFTTAQADHFTELTNSAVDSLTESAFAFGDYDGDGDWDLAMLGKRTSDGTFITDIYTNDGSGTYTALSAGISDVGNGDLDWLDFDLDGDLDLVVSGYSPDLQEGTLEVYENKGGGTFTALTGGLANFSGGSIAIGDLNRDGYPDFVIGGWRFSTIQSETHIYVNNGGTGFDLLDNSTSLLDPVYSDKSDEFVDLGDIDADGDLDIVIAGNSTSAIYRNDNMTFTKLSAGLEPLSDASVRLIDYDADGDLDLALAGLDANSAEQMYLFNNDGSGNFSQNSSHGIAAHGNSAMTWGDFDANGYYDLAISGLVGSTETVSLYSNNGDGTFSEFGYSLPGISNGALEFGHFDSDSKLDLVIAGANSAGSSVTKFYKSAMVTGNATPSVPPSGFSSNVTGDSVAISWSAPSDSETPDAGLSYNVRIGTTSGGSDIVPSNFVDGQDRIKTAGDGNARNVTTFPLDGLSNGTYYWAVQSVDPGMNASAFSAEQTFEVSGVLSDYSVSLDGTDDAVSFGSGSGFLDGVSTLTLSARIKPGNPTAGAQAILAELDGGSNFFFGLQSGKLSFTKWTGGVEDNILGSTTLQSNTWYHVAVTYNGSEVTLYLDGNLEATQSMTGALDSNASTLYAGSTTGGGGYYTGLIYDLKAWERARTQFAINDSVNISLSGSETGLAAFWEFGEGSGSSTADLVPSSLTGTLQNGTAWSTEVPNPEKDTTPPAVPTGLAASVTDDDVSLTWDDNPESDLKGYRLFRNTQDDATKTQVAFINAGTSAYTDTSLTTGTTYYYFLSSVDTILNTSDQTQSDAAPVLNTITEVEDNGSTSTADHLPINSSATGEITTSDDVDYYYFSGTSGDFIQINLVTDALDGKIEFFNSSGSLLVERDWVAVGTERILYGINVSGTFYIKITYYGQSSSFPNEARLDNGELGGALAGDGILAAGGGKEADSGAQTTAETGTYTLELYDSEPIVPALDEVGSDLDGVITLNWQPTYADSYQIFRSTSETSGYAQIGTITGSDYVDTGVTNGTEYFYKIKSVYNATSATSDFSNVLSGTPAAGVYDLQAGYALNGVTVDGTLSGGEWDDATVKQVGITGEDITLYIQNDQDSLYFAYVDASGDASTGNEFYVMFDLNQNNIYDGNDGYYAFTYDASAGSATASFTTLSGSYGGVSQTDATENGVNGAYSTVSGYSMEFAVSLSGSNTPMTFGGTYNIHVQTERPSITGEYPGPGFWYAPETLVPLTLSDGPVPSAPANVTATAGSEQISLGWDLNPAAEEVDSYMVYRSTDNLNFSQVATVSTDSYTSSFLTNGTTYYFYLIASSSSFGKVSVASDTVSATPAGNGPELIGISPAPGSLITQDSIITLTFDQPINLTSVGSGSDGIHISGDNSGNSYFFSASGINSDSTITLSINTKLNFAETVSVRIYSEGNSAGSLRNTGGLAFDGSGNDNIEGSPSDDSLFTFKVVPGGDLSGDGQVTLDDLTLLRDVWDTDFDKELGPVQGTFPYLQVVPDGQFDVEDLLTFIRYWNWTADGNSVSSARESSEPLVQTESAPAREATSTDPGLLEPRGTRAVLGTQSPGGGATRLEHLAFTPRSIPDRYKVLGAEETARTLEYDLNINFPDSLLGAEVIVDYDPEKVTLKGIHDNKVFETVKGRTIFLSRVDTLAGRAVINTVNFGSKLGVVRDKPLATLTFELAGLDMGEVSVSYDLRDEQNRPSRASSSFVPDGSTFELPDNFVLEQNYPNPFNPQTTIRYQIAEQSRVRILVYNVLGQRVATLVDSQVSPGFYRMQWNAARHLASGLYLYVMDIRAEGGVSTREVKKMMLIK